MEEPREIEEAEEDDLDTDEAGGDDPGPRSLATAEHIAKVDAETAFLTGLLPAERSGLEKSAESLRSALERVRK